MDLEAWLKGLGLDRHAEAFAENGVDAALPPELTDEGLEDCGWRHPEAARTAAE